MNPVKKVLTIAGSDSGAGAGIQADIKAITACGCYATSAITAITAQNTLGVRAIETLSLGIIEQQIAAIFDDIGTDAVKIGMLPNGEVVELVALLLRFYGAKNIVLDPVLVATSGDALAGRSTMEAMIKFLLPMVTIVTPNIPEAEVFSGLTIDSAGDFDQVWPSFKQMGARALLIKAGHMTGPELIDTLYMEGSDTVHYRSERIVTQNTHGTGCTLSSAIAAFLARGFTLPDAVRQAIEYINGAIRAAASQKMGSGHGPVDHFYRY